MPLPDAEYDAFLASLGRLCIYWASLDREINALIGALLDSSKEQVACIATEMNDVAPRCRLVKMLSYTIDLPQTWREDLAKVCNRISNRLGPERNRYVHDLWYESEAAMTKMDRRVKIVKPQSFEVPKLVYDVAEESSRDRVDECAIRVIAASATIATARFDLEALKAEGRFPERPQLSLERLRKLDLIRLQPDA